MQISMWFAALAFHRMNNNGEVRFGWLVFTLHIDVAVAELTTKSTNFYGRTKVDIFLILRIFFCFFYFFLRLAVFILFLFIWFGLC